MTGGPRTLLPELPPASLEALLDRSGALVYAVDADERVVTVNRAMRDRVDFDPGELADLRALVRLLYPEPAFREIVLEAHQRALGGARVRDGEWVLTTRQGDARQVRWQFSVHGDGAERVLVAVGEDVTDRRKLEQWVRLQNALLERVPEAVIVADLDGRIIHWTGTAEKLFGYSPRSALERPLSNLFPEENARAVVLDLVEALRARGEIEWTRELRRERGDTLECHVRAARVQNERAQMVAIALVVAPVTAPAPPPVAREPGASDDAEPIDDVHRLLGQVSSVAVVVAGADGAVRTWSRAAERLGGIGSGKATGKRFLDEVMQVDELAWDGLLTRLAARGRHAARVTVRRPNGTSAPADLDAAALRGPDGEILAVFAFLADRTELLAMSEQARQTKARALDSVFTEGMVRRLQDTFSWFEPDHRSVLARLQDLRSLARMVAAGASMREFDAFTRRSSLPETEAELDAVMASLGEGVHRLRQLTEDIGRFQSTEIDAPGPVRLSRELEAARDLVGHALEEAGVAVEFVAEDLPPARASRGPLLRGLCLLLLAGAESCAGVERAKITVEGRFQSGWLYLEAHDNGAGYSVDVQSRLQDLAYLAAQPGYAPLFVGMAREVLRAAGGTLEFDSAAGTGARFRVSFPAAESVAALRPVELARPRSHGRGRVLLVEDDDMLRRALERHVGEVHAVDAYATVAEALAALPKTRFDAAVIAFPRPESFGLRLLTRFAEAVPELHRNAIVIVPPGIKHVTRERLVQQGCIVLTRPIDFTTLRSLLDRLVPGEEIAMEEAE